MYYSRWATKDEVVNITKTLDPKSQITESGIPLGNEKNINPPRHGGASRRVLLRQGAHPQGL